MKTTNKDMTHEIQISEKEFERLRRLADRAIEARDQFEVAYAKAQQTPGWQEFCKSRGIPHAGGLFTYTH